MAFQNHLKFESIFNEWKGNWKKKTKNFEKEWLEKLNNAKKDIKEKLANE